MKPANSNESEPLVLSLSLLSLLLSVCCFLTAIHTVASIAIEIALERAGAHRPQPLMKLDSGGWEVDPVRRYDEFPLLGEVDSSDPRVHDERV